jgi:methionyl-tRNA formyltransferase
LKKDKEKIFQLSYLVFLNNIRGLNIIKLFSKKKMNFEAVITTKNLNKKILQDLKKLKVRHIIIKNCKNLKENLKKKYDVFVVAGFPHIFNQETLNLPKFGSINLHAGPLPKYRGGSPLNWQIINNEKKIGISIIKLNKKIDGGKILIKKYFDLGKNQNILNAHKKVNILFKKNIFDSIHNLLNKIYIKKIGKENYFRQRNRKDSEVKLDEMTATYVVNLARSQYPLYTSPFIIDKNNKIIFKKAYFEKSKNKKNYKFLFKCKKNYIGIKKKDIL